MEKIQLNMTICVIFIRYLQIFYENSQAILFFCIGDSNFFQRDFRPIFEVCLEYEEREQRKNRRRGNSE